MPFLIEPIEGNALAMRNEVIRSIWKHGKKTWKKLSGYLLYRRSLAKTAMYRFKSLFDEAMTYRKWQAQVLVLRQILL